jgi:hypothetical protein
MAIVITNFQVIRLNPVDAAAAQKKWASPEFVQSGKYWLASFEIDGVKHVAGIQSGRRTEITANIEQYEVQLNVRAEAFDNDVFIPEAEVADITRAVGEAFEKGEYWKV